MVIGIKIEFDAAHRVIGHKGKCRFLHGHRYILEVEIESSALDHNGFVVDFGDVKKLIKAWVDENFDHTCILSPEDKKLGENISCITEQKIYYLDSNPTAENISRYLFDKFAPLVKNLDDKNSRELKLKSIKVFETPGCYSHYC